MRRIKPNGVTVEQHGQRFVLHNITRVNSGMYMCRVGSLRRPLGQVYVVPTAAKGKVTMQGQINQLLYVWEAPSGTEFITPK